MDENVKQARRFDELDPRIKELLSRLEPENVETLKYISSIPKDELRAMMKMWRDLNANIRFVRWALLALAAIFLGTVALYENFLKVVGWLRGTS